MTYNTLHAVTTILTVGSYCLRQFCNLIHILTDVSVDIPRKTVLQLVAIANAQFPTVVLNLAGIDPLTRSFTHSSDTFHEEQNVCGLLIEPIKTTVDFVSQHCEINTDVMLCGGFPLDIVVAALIAYITVSQVVTTVLTADVV